MLAGCAAAGATSRTARCPAGGANATGRHDEPVAAILPVSHSMGDAA